MEARMIAKLTEAGLDRVLDGKPGMTFIVDKITVGGDGQRRIAHLRDYRYPGTHREFQIWSVGPEGYQLVIP